MPKCTHVIRHPQTEEERRQIQVALERAREIQDLNMVILHMTQLTERCSHGDDAGE